LSVEKERKGDSENEGEGVKDAGAVDLSGEIMPTISSIDAKEVPTHRASSEPGLSEAGAGSGEKEIVYPQHKKIKDISPDKRPREKLIREGAAALSTPELLAIVLRSGTRRESALELADRLYRTYRLHELANLDVNELRKHLGIGEAKACQILAAFQLGKRLLAYEAKPVFTRPADVANFLMSELSPLPQENFKCLFLDRKNRLIHDKTLFVGTRGESPVDPAIIMREAIQKNALGIILVHNHPSGDPTPSKEDVVVTKRLQEAGKILGIEIHDHIIIGNNSFRSLREMQLMS